MADQASMRANGPGTPGATAGRAGSAATNGNGNGVGAADVVTNVAEFGEDLLSLAELQARLAAIEWRQNVAAAKVGGAVIAVGGVMALAALPVALAGIAELLVWGLNWNRGAALLVVALATMLLSGLAMGLALARLLASDMGFPLSREEFTRNLNWLRSVLLYSGRTARRWR